MSAKKSDLRNVNLEFSNAGNWPIQYKIAACIALMVVIIGATWYFVIADQQRKSVV